MKINFTLTEQHFLEYQMHNIKKNKRFQISDYIAGVAFILYIIYFLYTEFQRGIVDWSTPVLLLFPLGVVTFIYSQKNKRIKKAFLKFLQDNPEMIGDKEIIFTPNEITCTTPNAETRFKKKSISSVEETETLLLLYLGKSNALLIPKNSISDSQLMEIKEQFQ